MTTQRPRICLLLGNGITYDFYKWLSAEEHPDPYHLLAPARTTPADYPYVSRYIAAHPSLSDPDLIMLIAETLRHKLRRRHEGEARISSAAPQGVAFMGGVDEEMEFRQCLWRACRDQDSWIEAQISCRRYRLPWAWPQAIRRLSQIARLSFISYNYDRVHLSMVYDAFENDANVVIADFAANLYDTPLKPRVIPIHGNIGMFQTGLAPGPATRNPTLTLAYCQFGVDFRWPPPTEIPYAPEIIPPGFASAASYWPRGTWNQSMRSLQQSNIIVAAGLSLRGIDFDEFCTLVNNNLGQRHFIHCVPNADDDLARKIHGINGVYTHAPAGHYEHFQLLEIAKRYLDL